MKKRFRAKEREGTVMNDWNRNGEYDVVDSFNERKAAYVVFNLCIFCLLGCLFNMFMTIRIGNILLYLTRG